MIFSNGLMCYLTKKISMTAEKVIEGKVYKFGCHRLIEVDEKDLDTALGEFKDGELIKLIIKERLK